MVVGAQGGEEALGGSGAAGRRGPDARTRRGQRKQSAAWAQERQALALLALQERALLERLLQPVRLARE